MTLSHRKTRSTHTPRRRARLAISVAAVILGVFACSSTAALATEPPETPISGEAKEITATTATLEGGVLNPKATGGVEGGEYRYLYNPSPEECNDDLVSEPSGIVTGLPKQPVGPVELTGLQPNLVYSFCLQELKGSEGSEESAIGPRESFKTLAAAPVVLGESASATGFSVSLGMAVNPNNEPTKYFFEYSTEATGQELKGTITKVKGENPLEGFGELGGGVNVSGLTQDTTYFYRVVVENAQSEAEKQPVVGEVQPFTTITPETPETLPPSELSPTGTSAKLNGVLNPKHAGEAGTYEFVYRQSASECEREKEGVKVVENATPAPAESSPASSPFPVSAPLTGLLPGKTYTYCLLAHTSQGEAIGPPISFTTPAVPPTVSEQSFSNVGSTSATLQAQIDPGGSPTTYFFEYTTETEYAANKPYGSATATQSAGAGSEAVSVLVNLRELQPETTYHFRVVASNAKTTSPVGGVDGSFSTFPAEVLGLPDDRGYELVSALDNGDATPLLGAAEVRAAANGSALTYWGTAPPVGGSNEATITPASRPSPTNVYLTQRAAAGGWTAADIQPAALKSAHYQGFSNDLSTGILGSEQALLEGAPNEKGHQGLYTRNDNNGSYQLLAAGASYEGATPDASHILLKSTGGLYDSTKGQLEPINILPTGEPAPNVTFGSPVGDNKPEQQASTTGDLERVISDDGSRIFWTALNGGQPEALYVRENDTSSEAATVQVDASTLPGTEKEKAEKGGAGTYMTASANGNKVFFTDEKKLTAESSAPGSPDLYLYNFEAPEGQRLTDLTAHTLHGESANVVGVLGASEDGSYIYFAAAGALSGTSAKPHECFPESSTKCNVYVAHVGEAPKLVAVTAEVDGVGNNSAAVVIFQGSGAFFGDWERNIGVRSAHVTPDGRRLVFASIEDLTGFDPERGREIYTYDFETGRTFCVSCNPSGAPTLHIPGGANYFAHAELPESVNRAYALRDVSVDGDRVFFESNERLVAQNTNEEASPLPYYFAPEELTNVYEWEREGTEGGSCPAKTPGRPGGGCIFLLSDGTSTDLSRFLDAGESGDDVFIETRAQLVPQDHSETYEVYDARVGATQPLVPPACTGSGCQGVPAAPPIFATPSSETAAGIGNFPPPTPPKKTTKKTVKCAKNKKANHGKCVTVKPKKKVKKKARRISNNRGPKS
jgi:hypothetical protein